jgi:hypothetical protein
MNCYLKAWPPPSRPRQVHRIWCDGMALMTKLPDVLTAMDKVHTAWRRTQRLKSTPTTPGSPPHSTREGQSSLRYAAYDSPSWSAKETARNVRKDRASLSRRGVESSMSAGDLALFDADDEDGLLEAPRGPSRGKVSLLALSSADAIVKAAYPGHTHRRPRGV